MGDGLWLLAGIVFFALAAGGFAWRAATTGDPITATIHALVGVFLIYTLARQSDRLS